MFNELNDIELYIAVFLIWMVYFKYNYNRQAETLEISAIHLIEAAGTFKLKVHKCNGRETVAQHKPNDLSSWTAISALNIQIQSYLHAVMPRSLNGLTITCQGDTLGGISQEIAQSLLRTPQMLHRSDSSNTTPPYNQVLDGSNCAVEDPDPEGTTNEPRTIRSRGTWTTLSREAWSDQDGIDDREDFIQEYNRLATKVGHVLKRPWRKLT
jgi:hypothetical protein